METITIDRAEYRDRVFACWMGKNIGGTLGEPYEGMRHTHALEYYDPVPSSAAPNDDLDLQLIWLKMLEEQGPDPSVRTFAEYWNRYASRYPWNEYGFFMRNYSRGLRPPVAGCFENYFVDEMGSPIRSEIWACLHPGDPQAAARLAWRDSALDHAGGEGMFGEMFWAALQAAAFVEKDPKTLIRIGLNMIPLSSHIARAIREAVWCHENGLGWGLARERIAHRFGHIQPCNAVPNHGFIIIGWLYGSDFGDCLCKAVNCGYDTDCTGATLGALLGILHGRSGIPEKWSLPVGQEIKLHKFTGDCDPPSTVSDLTDRTVNLAEKCIKGKREISFGSNTKLPENTRSRLFRNVAASCALQQDIHAGVELLNGEEVWFHYSGEPVIYPGIAKEVAVSVPGDEGVEPEVVVPGGWHCTALGRSRFRVLAGEAVSARNAVRIKTPKGETEFVLLGPGEARGFAAGANVPSCATCGARLEACMCRSR